MDLIEIGYLHEDVGKGGRTDLELAAWVMGMGCAGTFGLEVALRQAQALASTKLTGLLRLVGRCKPPMVLGQGAVHGGGAIWRQPGRGGQRQQHQQQQWEQWERWERWEQQGSRIKRLNWCAGRWMQISRWGTNVMDLSCTTDDIARTLASYHVVRTNAGGAWMASGDLAANAEC